MATLLPLPAPASLAAGPEQDWPSFCSASAAVRKTILVVEDDPTLRDTLREALEGHGYRVETAENGGVALEKIRRGSSPALVLLDLMMPEVDGWDFLARRRVDPGFPAIPIVVLSAYLTGPERDSALPASGFVRKPIEMQELLAEIERHLGA
jgi:CheY-like chemotaxis protein